MRVWDAHSGEAARLVSAGADGTVRVWDAQSGEPQLQLTGHSGGVRSCAFAPDGARLVSASDDGTVRVWDAHTGEALMLYLGTRTGTATLDLKANQVVELGGDAWRQVAWQVWDESLGWMPVPIETFGVPPEPKRLRRIQAAK